MVFRSLCMLLLVAMLAVLSHPVSKKMQGLQHSIAKKTRGLAHPVSKTTEYDQLLRRILNLLIRETGGQGLNNAQLASFNSSLVTITHPTGYHVLKSSGVPSHADNDTEFERNPNKLEPQSYCYPINANPVVTNNVSCMPMGPIGIALDGVPMFNMFSAPLGDAVEEETFDDCKGHPDGQKRYHYHQYPSCLDPDEEANKFLGVAFDGFPIFGPYKADGSVYTSAELDQCHGRYNHNGRYQYRITFDAPYTLGCYHGIPYLPKLTAGMRNGKCYCAVADEYTDDGSNSCVDGDITYYEITADELCS